MIRWYKNLMTGSMSEEDKKQAFDAVKNGKIRKNLYFILLPQNSSNLYDIIKHIYLQQDYYENQELSAVGIANSRSEAMEIVSRLITGAYQESGTARIQYEPGDFSEEPAEH